MAPRPGWLPSRLSSTLSRRMFVSFGLALVLTGCESEPECTEDWYGSVCAEDEWVVTVDVGQDRSLPEAAVAQADLLWSIETLPIVDEPLFSVRGAVATCASGVQAFAVLSASPNGVLAVDQHSGSALGWHGGAGEGPGEFTARVQDIWDSGACQVAVYDPGGHRVTWMTMGGAVDSVRMLPTAEGAMIQHQLVGRLTGGALVGLGFRVPGPPDPPEGGDVQARYRLGRYVAAEAVWRWEEAFEAPGIVQFISSADPPPQLNLGPSPFRPDTQVWTDSTGIWLANGHWPLLRRSSRTGPCRRRSGSTFRAGRLPRRTGRPSSTGMPGERATTRRSSSAAGPWPSSSTFPSSGPPFTKRCPWAGPCGSA